MGVKTIPQLPTDDLDVTSNFYRQLGFTERARWNEYLIRVREDLELHFWFAGSVDPLKNESSCYVRFDDPAEARDLYEQWAPLKVEGKDLHPLTETDYGLLEFALIDPHGNLVRVGGSISTSS